MGDGPQDGRIDGTTKVGMKFGTWGFGWLRHTRFYFTVVGRCSRPRPERGADIAPAIEAAIASGGPSILEMPIRLNMQETR